MLHNKAPKITAMFAGASLVLSACSSHETPPPPPPTTTEASPVCSGKIAQLDTDKGYYRSIGFIINGDCVTMEVDPGTHKEDTISLHQGDGLNGGCVSGDPGKLRLLATYESSSIDYNGSVPITDVAAATAQPPLPHCPIMPSTQPSVLA